jgi:ubiquinone/menaquinone biosynthesis C-methylase UbiE
MVAQAKHNVAQAGLSQVVDIQVAAADHLPFATASFDIVVSTGSIHHWKDLGAGLAEVYRVLRPGGYGLMYDLVADTPPQVVKELKQKYGLYRALLLRLHSLEEPFHTVEEFESLAAATPFRTGRVRFVGALCCLILKKEPPAS